MKLIDIYNYAVEKGIEKDPRSKATIKGILSGERKAFRRLKGIDRQSYDTERLSNPYPDTRILYGNPAKNVKTIMAGIDMESPEILVADRLRERGLGIDLVMAHHPEGGAWSGLDGAMEMQANILEKFGIPYNIASDLLKERIDEVRRALSGANHFRSVDIARLLDIPFMCVHTPADNHVAGYLQRLFDNRRPQKLSDVLELLKLIPEYQDGLKKNAGPKILIGQPDLKAGKIFVDMTGGTEGPKKVFGRLSQAGVGTIVAMHLSEEHFKNAKDEHINVVIAGHISSDNLGLNLFLDGLQKKSEFNIMPCSGFIRVKR